MVTASVPRDPNVVKKMADLLRAGAAMLAERCPICGLPLFRLKSGEVVCPIHGRVFIVKSESEYVRVSVEGVLDELEKRAVTTISSIMEDAASGGELSRLDTIERWLSIIERIERIRGLIRDREKRES